MLFLSDPATCPPAKNWVYQCPYIAILDVFIWKSVYLSNIQYFVIWLVSLSNWIFMPNSSGVLVKYTLKGQ